MAEHETLFEDALRRIAETAPCMPSMVGGCVGPTHTVHTNRGGEFVPVEEVNCAKHYAIQVLAEATK